MHKFKENVKWDIGIAARVGQTCTGSSVDMAKYNNFAAYLTCCSGTLANDNDYGDYICYLQQSTDDSTFVAMATATCFTSTCAAYGTSFEIRAEQMADSYRYLRVVATAATGTGNTISCEYFRFNSRYPRATLPA